MKAFLVCLFCFIQLYYVQMSHFRGGIIMWDPTQNRNEIRITFRVSWRRDFSENTNCDASTKDRLIGYNTGDMQCLDGCSTVQIGTMEFYCTDFSEDENWTSGENTLNYTFPESKDHRYQFGFKGNAWISSIINMQGGDWMLRTTASLAIRSDTGKINSSPKSVMQPIVRLQLGCNHTITIPVTDPDNDDVRCRWAIHDRDECGDICDSFSGANMYERECTISYSPKRFGWYGVAVQIEDFNSTESMEALSSVPLQFLVVVFSSNTTCSSKPSFVAPTRVDGSCIGIPFNTTYFEPLVSRSGSQKVSIREIQTASPQGMLKSKLEVYANREWYVNVSWTPDNGQVGPHIFCYTALDSNGANSNSICTKLLVGVSPPDIVEVLPVGDLYPNHNTWTIKFDKQFERPNRTTYMYFKDRDTDATIHKIDISTNRNADFPQGAIGKTLTVHTNFVFEEKKHYYVNLDPGAGRGKTDYCKVESEPIRNKILWSFRIRDITKPVLTFKSGPTATNGSINISWTFNEPVTSSCTIVKPDRTEKVKCNNSWSGNNLKEGFYTLFIFGTDLEGNQADVGKYEFQIEPTTDSVRWNLTSAAERHDVSCLSDSISVFIPSDLLSHYQTTWRDPHCQVHDNGTHYVSTISHTSCGTTVIFTKDEVIFENELILHKSGSPSNQTSNGSIDFGSSDSEVIPVQCIYPRRQNISTLYRPAQSTVRFYEKRYGHMDVQLEQYKSGMFVTPLPVRSFPNEVEINKDMYFILHAMHVNSTDVAVKVDSCVATPSNMPADGRIYQLLDQGCPASPAVKVYPSAFDEVRFSVRAFEFRTSPGGIVYIHCQVSVCSPTSPQCRVGCANRHRREVSTEDGGSHLVSGGPYLLVADKGGLQVSTVVAGVCASVAVVATVIAIIGWRRKSSASTSSSKL